jgi:hypothetical protein
MPDVCDQLQLLVLVNKGQVGPSSGEQIRSMPTLSVGLQHLKITITTFYSSFSVNQDTPRGGELLYVPNQIFFPYRKRAEALHHPPT